MEGNIILFIAVGIIAFNIVTVIDTKRMRRFKKKNARSNYSKHQSNSYIIKNQTDMDDSMDAQQQFMDQMIEEQQQQFVDWSMQETMKTGMSFEMGGYDTSQDHFNHMDTMF